ncbi:MAG: methyltransferase domain-containing protein [Chthoniobacterales bacterium]|nr:methyltransferase domain-containing protein [Chthoniobacterales bacterium]
MAYFRDLISFQVQPKFWAKTLAHLLAPGGYGYMRRLRSGRDESYNHERDKHPVRHKHHGAGGWKEGTEEGFRKRDYSDYDEYLTHQRLKLEELVKIKGGFSNFDIFDYRLKFYSRFRRISAVLPPAARILCCGARQGTEVDVLRDIGFLNARGIDLNPGPDNLLVEPGDMMKLAEPENSLDLIYTNCVDHSFDLDAMIAEHARALKPDGYLLYDIAFNEDEGSGVWESIAWEREEDVVRRLLDAFRELVRVERDRKWVWVLVRCKQQK